jgi:hypothetical protein
MVRQAGASAAVYFGERDPADEVLGPNDGPGMSWVEGDTYLQRCGDVRAGGAATGDDISTFVYDPADPAPAPVPPPAELVALEAAQQVPLVAPHPRTSPPDADLLVGLPTWLWIDPAAWQPFTATAAVPGVSVTVTATPTRVVWDMGDDEQVTCSGPGTPWDPAGGDDQRTDCSYTYRWVSAHRPDGVYHASATVQWAVTWGASTGETGTLADASRTTALDLTVTERQAVVSYGRG